MNHHTMKTNETDTTTATAAQSTKSTVLLSIDKIRPNPNNPRRSYDENALAELAASIATHGLIQPIRVRAAEQGGYIIVCGERRYRAVQLLGQTEIEAIVDAVPADERAIFDLALSENIQREEMPPLDEAEAYKAAMQTLRGDAAAVAARFGKSEQYIYYRMKLNELIPDAKKLLRENSITLGLAMELARYGKDLQKTICKDRLKDEEGWRKYSVKEFKRMVRRPLYERSGPVPLRPNGVRQMQAQHQSIRYVRHGKRTVYEPGMSRSQKPRIHRAKKRRTARAKPEIHPLQRPLRMRRP